MSPLGLLNFLVLQWFGVRLARITCPNCERLRTHVWSYRCPEHARATVLRWIWPLTGWWSDYRWIAKRDRINR